MIDFDKHPEAAGYDLPDAPLSMPEQRLERSIRPAVLLRSLRQRMALLWRPGI